MDIRHSGLYDETTDYPLKYASVEAKVRAIKQRLGRNELFVDESFPNLAEENNKMRRLLQASSRPRDFKADYFHPNEPWVMYNEERAEEVVQGEVEDCWLVGAIANVGTRTDILSQLLVSRKYSSRGVYGLLLFYKGQWQEVIVDDKFPCKWDGKPACAHTRSKQLWVPLLEKAVAKLMGSYSILAGGQAPTGFQMFTTCLTNTLYFTSERRPFTERKKKFAIKLASYALENSMLVCAEIAVPEKNAWRYTTVGLVPNHCYTAHDFITVLPTCQLIMLRNVWGCKIWNGDWSPNSELWQLVPSENLPAQGKGNEHNGTFWLNILDLFLFYNTLRICNVYLDYFLYSLKSVMICSRSSQWNVMQFELTETCYVDVSLVFISSDAPHPKRLSAMIALFDEYDNLMACSDQLVFSRDQISIPLKLLHPGTYKAYCISFDSWLDWNTTEFCFLLHSTKKVQCKLVTEPTLNYAPVLLKMNLCVGVPYCEKELRVYKFGTIFVHGSLLVAINFSSSQTFQIDTTFEFPDQNMRTTRRKSTTVDTIPPLHSQILQVAMAIDPFEQHGFNLNVTDYELPYKLGRKIDVKTKSAVPRQSWSLHRLIPNDAYMRR